MNVNGSVDSPTVTLELPATVARLRERASSAGLPLVNYLDRVAEVETADLPLDRLASELDWLANRTPEEIEQTRLRLFSKSPASRPIPEGQTLADMVEGKWPGDETDEQVREALERLS